MRQGVNKRLAVDALFFIKESGLLDLWTKLICYVYSGIRFMSGSWAIDEIGRANLKSTSNSGNQSTWQYLRQYRVLLWKHHYSMLIFLRQCIKSPEIVTILYNILCCLSSGVGERINFTMVPQVSMVQCHTNWAWLFSWWMELFNPSRLHLSGHVILLQPLRARALQ